MTIHCRGIVAVTDATKKDVVKFDLHKNCSHDYFNRVKSISGAN